jgi:nitronate monooxygenase
MNIAELLGVELPIVQAPMAGVQDSALAISVAKAGGLGSLPCAMLSTEHLESELATLKNTTDIPINLNFFCHQTPTVNPHAELKWLELLRPYFLELNIDPASSSPGASRQPFSHQTADVLETYSPEIISFHFGLPSPELVKRVKAWGTTILSSATTLEEALWLEANGADVIIAQGVEAGGHRAMFLSSDLESQTSTTFLVKQITRETNLPVIATGGLGSASDIANIVDQGAVAAQVGTAYLLCHEAKTSPLHRDAIQKNESSKTILTNIFSGRPARGIVNKAIHKLGAMNTNAPEFPLAATPITELRRAAEAVGSSDFTPLWCGENTRGCASISAHEMTLRLVSEL